MASNRANRKWAERKMHVKDGKECFRLIPNLQYKFLKGCFCPKGGACSYTLNFLVFLSCFLSDNLSLHINVLNIFVSSQKKNFSIRLLASGIWHTRQSLIDCLIIMLFAFLLCTFISRILFSRSVLFLADASIFILKLLMTSMISKIIDEVTSICFRLS